jgi:hypothetical protein
MLGADVSGDPGDRTAADNQTVRNVFVIGPNKKVKLVLVYPMTTGRNFDEVLDEPRGSPRVEELARVQGADGPRARARRRVQAGRAEEVAFAESGAATVLRV